MIEPQEVTHLEQEMHIIACRLREKYDLDSVALLACKQKIWPLEGYLLKQRLAATPREGERPDSRGAARTYSSASMDMDNAP